MQPNKFVRLFFILIITSATVVLGGCGSMSKDAKKLMENGDYQSAVDLWDRVLTKDPTDAEAKFYRQMSQGELLNQDLVTLKGLIDSRQTLIAFEQLKKYHDKRSQWGLGLNPNSALYLKQQTDRLYVRYLELEQQALQKGYIVKALWLENNYRPLMDTVPNDDEKEIKKNVQLAGEKKCSTLEMQSKNLPYLHRYAMIVCKKFAHPISASEKLEQAIDSGRIQLRALNFDVDFVNENEGTAFTTVIQDQVKNLAAYSPRGKIPEFLSIKGAFAQQKSEKTIPMSHSYQVDIPYTDYEIVTRPKSIPYSVAEEHCTANATRCWSETVTRYRQEDDHESVAVTRFRKEPRVYEFTGLEMTNKMTLELEILGRGFKLPYEQTIEEKVTSHNKSLPDIGLTPKVAAPTEKADWLKLKSAEVGKLFYEAKVNQWTHDHCSAKTTLQKSSFLDQALHCIQQREGKDITWVQQAAQDHEGLAFDQIAEVVGPIAE